MLSSAFKVFILMMGLTILGPFSLAQDPAQDEMQEVHDTKKLDQVLQNYNKDQKKVEKDAEMIREMETTGEVSDEELSKGQVIDPDNEKAIEKAHESLGASAVFNPKMFKKKKDGKVKVKYEDEMRKALMPLQSTSEEEILTKLKELTKDSQFGEYLNQFPKIGIYSVRLVKEPEALPKLASILDDQDKLIRFGGIMVATILLGFFLRRFMAKEGRSIGVAISLWFLRMLIIMSLRVGIIILFYGDEITPAFNVALKTFFNF